MPGPQLEEKCARPSSSVVCRAPSGRWHPLSRSRAAAIALSLGALSFQSASPAADLAGMSFDELADIRITSVSKRDESLADAAASVFVITNDDIRRSGVTSLPEALRLAPNLHVAQINANNYVISARGFSGTSANKMLVLIDGRSVYTPLFSGVFWDVQNVMLEDVDRIEVISGPGGTLWGTNAVNGVINVITRSAANTQGGLATVGAGNRESTTALRYGGRMGADGSYRVYGKYGERKHTETARGSAIDDASNLAQAGFRIDWGRAGDQLMMQGNVYDGSERQPATGTTVTVGAIQVSGVNLLTRWERALEREGKLSLQFYYDSTKRNVPPFFNETLNIVDLQLQHALPRLGSHALVWGAEYRYGMDRVTNSPFIAFLPAHVDQRWVSLFAQDEMTLREDLRFTLGARFEKNDYTGVEFLPNARLAWKMAPDHLLWGAASRTVRAPSRLDRDVFVPDKPPFLLSGGPDVRSEIANVYELGYRGQPNARLSFAATAFHADYDRLRTQERNLSPPTIVFANNMKGKTSGIEMWSTFQATPIWRLSAGYTVQKESLKLKAGSTDQAALRSRDQDPAHKWILRSSLDLSERSDVDITVRHVAGLANPDVPSYTAVDIRYGWRPRPNLEFSVTAQNLGSKGHGEFTNVLTRSQLEPSAFLKVLTRF